MNDKKPKIASWLDENNAEYRIIKFSKEVYTVEESAAESGVNFDQIIKSMLLVDKDGKYIMACLPGNKKINAAKVKKTANLNSRPHFASAEEVEKELGLKVGAVTALYAVGKVPIIFDESIRNLKKCSLSSGEHLYEIIIKTADLINLIQPQFADISK